MDLVAGAAVEFVIAHGRGDIGPALPDRLAGVARFERGEFVAMLFDELAEPGQAAAALERRHPAHGPSSKRCRAALTARSTSASPDAGMEAKTLPSEGADDVDASVPTANRQACRR